MGSLKKWESIYYGEKFKRSENKRHIEALYMIESLARKAFLSGDKEVNICFVFPNDEWKYYYDGKNSINQDVKSWLELRLGKDVADKKIRVEFCTFNYGDSAKDRPYNAGKKVIKKIEKSDLV